MEHGKDSAHDIGRAWAGSYDIYGHHRPLPSGDMATRKKAIPSFKCKASYKGSNKFFSNCSSAKSPQHISHTRHLPRQLVPRPTSNFLEKCPQATPSRLGPPSRECAHPGGLTCSAQLRFVGPVGTWVEYSTQWSGNANLGKHQPS